MMLLILLACASPTASDVGRLSYTLAWDLSGQDTKAPWTTTLEDGTLVELSEGVLVSHRMQLAPCFTAGLGDLLMPSARAGHNGLELNASAVDQPTLELLPYPSDQPYGGALDFGSWCSGEYVASPSETSVEGWPELDGLSLLLHLRVRGGDGSWTELTASSSGEYRSMGGLFDSAGQAVSVDLAAASTTVTARRDLSRLFEGLEAADLADPELGDTLLLQLVSSTRLLVTPTP